MNRESKKYIVFFVLIATIKLLTFFWFSSYHPDTPTSTFFPVLTDDEGAISTADKLVTEGEWYYVGYGQSHIHDEKILMRAPRMPGQGLAFLMFRAFLPFDAAINALLIFQLLFYCLSLVLFTKSLSLLYGRKAYWVSLVIFSIDAYSSIWSHYPEFAETLANSLVLIGLSFFIRFLLRNKMQLLFYCGIFLGLSFFFKVQNVVVLFFTGIILLSSLMLARSSVKKMIMACIVFSIPFIILESVWIVRNYAATSRFIPLQEFKAEPVNIKTPIDHPLTSCINFVKSFGGDPTFWNPKSEIAWFNSDVWHEEYGFPEVSDDVFPKYIFTDQLTIEDLSLAKKYMNEYGKQSDPQSRSFMASEACRIFDEFKMNIYHNHPFRYHVVSRLRILKNFYIHSGTYYFPYSFEEGDLFEKGIKASQFLVYYLILIIGSFSSLMYLIYYLKNKDKKLLFPILLILIITGINILYCFVYRTTQYRYNSLVYLLLLILTITALSAFIDRRRIFDKEQRVLRV